jgi:hypothetical protein
MFCAFLSYHTPDRAVALSLKRAIEAALPGAEVLRNFKLRARIARYFSD